MPARRKLSPTAFDIVGARDSNPGLRHERASIDATQTETSITSVFMAVLRVSVKLPAFSNLPDCPCRGPNCCGLKVLRSTNSFPLSISKSKLASLQQAGSRSRSYFGEPWSFLGGGSDQNCDSVRGKKRAVAVRSNFNGGGGRDKSGNARFLGNLSAAIGLACLTMTGQLGWVLDTVVSIWLFAVLLPIAGVGAFLWWAGKDVIQSSCPNCGNIFQMFKSSLNDELQLCPFCSQPFSVVGDEFVRDPVKFSNSSKPAGEAFNGFSHSKKKGKGSSSAVVDVQAKIVDAD